EGILERAADFVEHLAYAPKARFVGARVHRKGRCQLQAVDVIVRETIGATAGEADHAHQLAVGVDRADRAREDAARPAPDGRGPPELFLAARSLLPCEQRLVHVPLLSRATSLVR